MDSTILAAWATRLGKKQCFEDTSTAQVGRLHLRLCALLASPSRNGRRRSSTCVQSRLLQKRDSAQGSPTALLPPCSQENSHQIQISAYTSYFPRYENLCVMYNQVTTKISARDFLGGPYVVGTDNSAATVNVSAGEVPGESGGMESVHNVAHEWTGLINDPEHPDNEDMGNFIYAARDPIFYSHHSNVDRLWDVWKTIPDKVTRSGNRKRMDYTSRDFLDSEFTFFDENQDMVIVKIRDSLDSSKLGYKFTDVSESDNMWIYYEPMPAQEYPSNSSDYPAATPSGYNYIGTDPVSFRLDRRAPTSEDAREKGVKNVDQLQEDVVLERVKIPHLQYARFDVFINYPAANRQTRLYMSEFVGTFTHLPSGMVDMSRSVSESSSESEDNFRIVTIRYSVNAALKRLGITDYNTDIVVTIVSKGARNSSPKTGFTFSNLIQDFQ
ncbi:hypothetical protein AXG93_2615s1210 [Marchantia polymorpha subsp. ruderalis]|uniref:Tyrosinase copper-binding domain-containing protein n=1 Tax=Marchantia polymorpha subsp. ruderalis TaxID=1480154 RepID=A0A176WFF6_MARPO|nr:hypothetical protein AXG93_2615s1210 [Marchantia polymorpha subsp. ruderalis]